MAKIAGINLKNAGEKTERPKEQAVEVKSPEYTYPQINMYGGKLPNAEDFESDKEYLMVAKVKCTSTEVRDEKGKKVYRAGLDILSCGFKTWSEKSVDEMSAEEIKRKQRETVDEMED